MSKLIELEKRIAGIEKTISNIESIIAGFKIDKQLLMQADNKVRPGIGTKVSYDKYGRITGSLPLDPSDIPSLSPDKISGLSSLLEDKATKSDINSLSSKLESVNHHTKTVKTGTVVNVDENGLVNDVSDLTPENIPELPLSKIHDLPAILDQLKSNESLPSDHFTHQGVTPNTAVKVSYDQYGHIIQSYPLSEEDIPADILARLNRIESKLADMATRDDMNNLSVALNNKMDIPANKITPGTYTKLSVNENGLVTGVDSLTDNDIPSIPISSVKDLSVELANKASINNMEELSNNLQSRIHSIETNEPELPPTPSLEEFRQLKHSYDHLSELVNTLLAAIPGDQILQEIDNIRQELSTISGRISVLESNNDE